MVSRRRLHKKVDDTDHIRCSNGSIGTIREEVYVDEWDVVLLYNLAFVNLTLCHRDNGRVLGCDNAHGRHERHFLGEVQEFKFLSYEQTLERFLHEVAHLKESA